METQEKFQRGIHLWTIAAESWDLDQWRTNIKGAPSYLIEAALKIKNKSREEKERLMQRSISLPADNIEDYVKYEILADLSLLSEDALSKLADAIDMNEMVGPPEEEGEIDWRIYGNEKFN